MSTLTYRRSLQLSLLLLVSLLLLAPASLQAVPANPSPISVSQPSGLTIKLRLRGDEFYHWLEDLQGYTVIRNATGSYMYAQLEADGNLAASTHEVGASDPAAAGIPKGLREVPSVVATKKTTTRNVTRSSGGAAATPLIAPSGTVKNLVILCRFSDHPEATHTRPQADFDALFNSVYKSDGTSGAPAIVPTGSVRDYFSENSYRTMTLESTVTAWVALPYPESFYADQHNGFGPYPTNVQGMVEHALTLVDPLVNFADFDQNNDGYVDAITFIHSGYGAEAGEPGRSARIWSAKAALASDWESAENNSQGVKVKVKPFHTEPALWGTSGTEITRIAVICHEMCHFFGLPDLYDTDRDPASLSQGAGIFCLMANGWGYDGTQLRPSHLSAWCKAQLGWVTPNEIYSPFPNSALQPVVRNPSISKISTGYPPGEYLLLE